MPPIDVPIFADLAKVHATLSRDAEGYILESSRGAMINGKAVTRAALKSGDRITLGSTCQLAFDQPSPLSPTARLDLVSGHRFQMAVDAILLMADLLVLGPGDEPHVPLSSRDEVTLYRGPDGLVGPLPRQVPRRYVSISGTGQFAIAGQHRRRRACLYVSPRTDEPELS